MNKETLEHLSSLMDGELSHETSLFVARRLGSDPELGATWGRYHLIRDCLRRPGEERAIGRLSVDLDAHAPAEEGRAAGPPRWLRPLSGAAIAASVALVAVLMVGGERDPLNPQSPPAPFASPNPLGVLPETEPVSYALRPDRLNDYLIRHNRVAGQVGRQGFVTVVPIQVSPEAQAESVPAAADASTEKENGARPDGEPGARR